MYLKNDFFKTKKNMEQEESQQKDPEPKEFKSIEELLDYVDEMYHGWITVQLESFSKDYDFLNMNWSYVSSNLLQVEKQKIILVKSFIEHKDSFKLAELLTRFGFVVRSAADFDPCSICQRAIPSESVYEMMKKNEKKVPEIWSNVCTSCIVEK
jgi:hypothetical protein